MGGVSVLAFAGALAAAIRHPLGRRSIPLALAGLGLAFYASAIIGRGSGNHGFATIFSTFELLDPRLLADVAWTSLYTVFEGIPVAAQAATLTASHGDEYKILSFSLLPSFLDGFSAIRSASEVRISEFVPIGAWSESLMFGYGYFVFWLAIILTCLITNVLLNNNVRSKSLAFLNMALLVSLLLTNAYPVRNNLRILVLIAVVQIVALIVTKRFRLRAHGRNSTVAAMAMADTKSGAHRS